jgi:beta-lactamase superfamily II metal-dependent hydrolase
MVANILKVHFIDVGGGDGIIIETPTGKKILIDGGYTWSERNLAEPEYMTYIREVVGSDRIDLMVISHPDYDHFAGLAKVHKGWDVSQAWFSGYDSAELSGAWREFDSALKADPDLIYLSPLGNYMGLGTVLRFDDASTSDTADDTVITLVNSQEKLPDLAYGSQSRKLNEAQMRNSTSIILRLDFGVTSFLFTGDVNGRGKWGPVSSHDDQEKFMVDNNDNPHSPLYQVLDTDVLKVAHHGSDGSSSLKFLESASPLWAVLLAGNPHQHPDEPVIERLLSPSVGLQLGRILRTDSNDTGRTSEENLGDDTFVFVVDTDGIVAIEKWNIRP